MANFPEIGQNRAGKIVRKWPMKYWLSGKLAIKRLRYVQKRKKISKYTGKLARKYPEHTDQIISRKHGENTTEIILILINRAETVPNILSNCLENTQTTC
jgi:hypothetical protein